MENFMRKLALTYGAVVTLLVLWAGGVILASLHEPRELPTFPELLLYVVSLPMSHKSSPLYDWTSSIFDWRFSDLAALTAAGFFQTGGLYVIAALLPKVRHVAKSSSNGE